MLSSSCTCSKCLMNLGHIVDAPLLCVHTHRQLQDSRRSHLRHPCVCACMCFSADEERATGLLCKCRSHSPTTVVYCSMPVCTPDRYRAFERPRTWRMATAPALPCRTCIGHTHVLHTERISKLLAWHCISV